MKTLVSDLRKTKKMTVDASSVAKETSETFK